MGQDLRDYLTENNIVAGHSLDRATRIADETREDIGDVLNKLGLLSEQDLVNSYSAISGVKTVDKDDFPEERIYLPEIENGFLKSSRVLPFFMDDKKIKLAVVNPFDDFPKKAIEYVTEKQVEYYIAPVSDITLFYDETESASPDDNWINEHDDLSDGDDLARLKDMASEAPVIRYVNRLMHNAVNVGASDIHIEPMEASLKIRMRLDGMLEDIEDPPHRFKSAIISRIKILAGLDIAERRLPQDGRIRMAVQGRDIDFRISTTPTVYGESVVMRVLNQHKMVLDLEKLGFPDQERAVFIKSLEKPNGIILVTGPTGSGKTTTLYAALKILNKSESKILTIEDPIEYMLEGVNQVQVNTQIGLSFASALRSFLRQDPDIMMVGEIRDIETANIAVQASLTGHLILSTLHTNSAAGAIARLLDMGVEDFLLSSTLNMVMAQRLVRKLCEECKQLNKPSGHYHHKGCASCQQSGFKGRTMVIELLVITPDIEQLIKNKASETQIEQVAISQGMRTMEQQATCLVEQGVTTYEEVRRVLGEDVLFEEQAS